MVEITYALYGVTILYWTALISLNTCMDFTSAVYICCLLFLSQTLLRGLCNLTVLLYDRSMFALALCMPGVADTNLVFNHTPCVQVMKFKLMTSKELCNNHCI